PGETPVEAWGKRVLASAAGHPWYEALIRLTLGQVEPSELEPLARDAQRRGQLEYYAGARSLSLGRSGEARERFEACLRINADCVETNLAAFESIRELNDERVRLCEEGQFFPALS